jgi:hypothetical protein
MTRRHVKTSPEIIGADTTPLRAIASTGISHVILSRPDDRTIVVKPTMFFTWAGGVVGLMLVFAGTAIFIASGNHAGLFVPGIGLLVVIAFLLIAMFQARVEFDCARGVMLVKRLGMRRRHSLERVKAVQLIEGGWHTGTSGSKFFTYQLNLVLDDPDVPRMNLTNASNWDATWTMGSELAEFLGVRFQDHVSGKQPS